jgi:hypothetical protein
MCAFGGVAGYRPRVQYALLNCFNVASIFIHYIENDVKNY